MNTENREFRILDLGQAAYLQARGFLLNRLERAGARRFAFIFDASAARVADGFYRNEPMGAWDFFNAIHCLKARIKNEKGCAR